ncbi:2-succinyl-5-enolpyruvyl-6-hydroxy-3-cyclohexene-1-carboxylic-acid synthase [Gracilibacillus sp. Marseille-QA3620]
MKHQEALTAYIASFVDELTACGVRDVVISPGSRSTPVAYCMAEHEEMRVHVNIDERSAAFFALGMAKEKRSPVAILCTSGTAAANYYPAIVEAHYARVPLIVLTADRPHELREIGAPQAIDQLHLYGQHVKWFVEMSLPDSAVSMLHYARTVAARAAGTAALAPAGPVHINIPLREPLIPNLSEMKKWVRASEESRTSIDVRQGSAMLTAAQFADCLEVIKQSKRGLIICGSIDQPGFDHAVFQLSRKTGFPIIADPLSQLRGCSEGSEEIIETYDTFLKDSSLFELLKPDLIIRFGSMPVSKPLLLFIKAMERVNHLVIDGGLGWREPTGMGTHMLYCDERAFCEQISAELEFDFNLEWHSLWKDTEQAVKQQLNYIHDETVIQEGKLFAKLNSLLPHGANLVVGNSMPIRNVDTFFYDSHKEIRIFANRGANGIDGTVSTALGIAASSDRPTVLTLGDLSFFHDMNGFLAAKMYGLNLLVLVINNDGGGIFSFLPQAEKERHFEELFGTPHGLSFEHTAALYGARYVCPATWEEVDEALHSWSENPDFRIVEMKTNRQHDVDAYRELVKGVSREIRVLHHVD